MSEFINIAGLRDRVRPGWALSQTCYVPDDEGGWETLLTLANGYIGLRGSVELPSKGRSPAVYFAGVYDKPDRPELGAACGLKLLNKALTPALAIAPLFNLLEIEIAGVPLDFMNCEIQRFNRTLDLEHGLLFGDYLFKDAAGRLTSLRTLTCVSLSDRHCAVLRADLEAKNYSDRATVKFCTEIDTSPGYIPRLRDYISRTDCLFAGEKDDSVRLEARVVETGVAMAVATRTRSTCGLPTVQRRQHGVCETFSAALAPSKPVAFDRQISFFTSLDGGSPAELATGQLKRNGASTETVLKRQADYLRNAWELADVAIEGDDEVQQGIRWDIFNLIQLGNPESSEVSITATGLHGQGYFGHIFWDTEIFMLPFYQATDPASARNLLLYRYNRLEAARKNAMDWGFKGARFPWTSTWKGLDVTPGDWGSRFELHISGDVALAFEKFLAWSGDWDFYKKHGIEVMVETGKFWASRLKQGEDGRYHLLDIVGPDEYHRHANDNYFSNHLAAWNMRQAVRSMELLRADDPVLFSAVSARTGWTDAVRAELEDRAAEMFFPRVRNGVCEQHDGYFDLNDVEPLTRGRYMMPQGGSHGYGKNSQMNKQADVVMMHYLFEDDFDMAVKRASYKYYDNRCIQGSSLSPAIFCIMGLKVGLAEHAYGYFQATALLDLKNLHLDKNLHEGIHAACAGGTWKAAVFGYGGVACRNNELAIAPRLPSAWKSLRFGLVFRGRRLTVSVASGKVTVTVTGESMPVTVYGARVLLQPATEHVCAIPLALSEHSCNHGLNRLR